MKVDSGRRLLADCGNTWVKLALGGDRVRLRATPDALTGWLAGRPADELVLLPGGVRGAEVLRSWWGGQRRELGRDIPVPDLGQYPGMGLDRVMAGVAAGANVIVIDAGTATTLSAWDAQGRFAGGLILPGAHALIAGLVACAPALPQVVPLPPDAIAAQRDTRGAMAAAAGISHPAMVAACLARLRQETGISRLLATGGGCPQLASAGTVPADAVRPWLVLNGLGTVAEAG